MKSGLQKKLIKPLAAAALTGALCVPVAHAKDEIDLLVFYDDHTNVVMSGNVRAKVQLWINDVNDYFAKSGTDVQINMVGLERREVPSKKYVLSNMKSDERLLVLREKYNADLVTQLTQLQWPTIYQQNPGGKSHLDTAARWMVATSETGDKVETLRYGGAELVRRTVTASGCSVENLNASAVRLSWTRSKCEDLTVKHVGEGGVALLGATAWVNAVDSGSSALLLAHEIGHNIGLDHSARQPAPVLGSKYSYGRGHGVHGEFVTIMAYRSYYGMAPQVGFFSNPDLTCPGEHPCGVEVGDPLEANAALAINQAASGVADFRSRTTPHAIPQCVTAAADTDSDGWGYENGELCRTSATGNSTPTCSSTSSDPDGDGWGWENGVSCKIAAGSTSNTMPTCSSASADPDGDGFGWENSRSCRVR